MFHGYCDRWLRRLFGRVSKFVNRRHVPSGKALTLCSAVMVARKQIWHFESDANGVL